MSHKVGLSNNLIFQGYVCNFVLGIWGCYCGIDNSVVIVGRSFITLSVSETHRTLSNISKSRGMMNLFPYASAIALSYVFPGDLSLAFILNFMQFSVQPSIETIPCLTAFIFSDFVFHRSL